MNCFAVICFTLLCFASGWVWFWIYFVSIWSDFKLVNDDDAESRVALSAGGHIFGIILNTFVDASCSKPSRAELSIFFQFVHRIMPAKLIHSDTESHENVRAHFHFHFHFHSVCPKHLICLYLKTHQSDWLLRNVGKKSYSFRMDTHTNAVCICTNITYKYMQWYGILKASDRHTKWKLREYWIAQSLVLKSEWIWWNRCKYLSTTAKL